MSDTTDSVSSYEEIADLHRAHGISVVKHRETGRICVKKRLSVYSLSVYEALKDHPVRNTPRIYALQEQSGVLTVIEEYISGTPLSELLETSGPLPEKTVRELTLQLCQILTDLHSFEPPVIHRDIKPSNLILREDGALVLLDMNAAKFETPEKSADTRLLGTPGYAAPEQFGFGSSSVRTDLYAVGVLMNTLLTGLDPGDAGTAKGSASTAKGSADTEKGATSTENGDAGTEKGLVSPGMQKIIDRCRELNPAERYHSARELAAALSESASESSAKVPSEKASSAKASYASASSQESPVLSNSVPQTEPVFSHPGGGKRKFLLPAAAAAAVLLLSAVLLVRLHPAQETVPTAPEMSSQAAEHETTEIPAQVVAPGTNVAPAQTAAPGTAESPVPPVFPEGLCGSYKGATGSGLTLYPDGTAVYYHEILAFCEPADPWTYQDGKVSVELAKMHCTITAETDGSDFSTLVFCSESQSWDDERFSRLPEENPVYLQSALRSNDAAVTVLPDGQMELAFGGLSFTVPKHFLCHENAYSKDKNAAILSSVWTDENFMENLIFHYGAFDGLATLDTELLFPGHAKEFLYSFYYDVELTDVKEETIAGTRAFIARFTGETNKGFGGVTGMASEGYVAFFCNDEEGKLLRICLSQNAGKAISRLEELLQIVESARKSGASAGG